jgi:hypothetical protein
MKQEKLQQELGQDRGRAVHDYARCPLELIGHQNAAVCPRAAQTHSIHIEVDNDLRPEQSQYRLRIRRKP